MSFDLDRIGGYVGLNHLIDEVCRLGDYARGIGERGAATKIKSDASPVTEADEFVERALLEYLKKQFPAASVLGEEFGLQSKGDELLQFVIDPIDGTRAFIRGIPTWSVLVGLESRQSPTDEWNPVVGLVYMPAVGELYVGIDGLGAKENGRPLRMSTTNALEASAVAHGALSQFHEQGVVPLLGDLAKLTFTQRGFADFDGYRNLLRGRVDAMIDPSVKPWDMCAASVLVREAGGTFTDLLGKQTIYGGNALATNGLLHEAYLELTRKAMNG